MNTRRSVFHGLPSVWAAFFFSSNRCCRRVFRFGFLGQVLDGDAMTGFGSVVFLLKKSVLEVCCTQVDIAHEAVVDHASLGAVLPISSIKSKLITHLPGKPAPGKSIESIQRALLADCDSPDKHGLAAFSGR